jgi:hypothetical protein
MIKTLLSLPQETFSKRGAIEQSSEREQLMMKFDDRMG